LIAGNVDTGDISIFIKLHKNSNPAVDYNNLPTKVFKRELFIGDNYMNDKRDVAELQQLKNLAIDYQQRLTMAQIIYQQRPIKLLFDIKTALATVIYIY
jgi:hypothetical protein